MSEKLLEKYFVKFNKALSAKAIPTFQIIDENPKTVYSLLEVYDLQVVIDIFECFLLQGFNKLKEDLTTKIKNGQLTINDAKAKLDASSKILNEKIADYSCELSKSQCPILTSLELINNPSLLELNGIINDDVTKAIKGISAQISKYQNEVTRSWELNSIKIPLAGKLYIKKSIPITKIEALYNQLTKPGKEIFSCSLYEFEHLIKGTYTSGRIKVSTKAAINTFVTQLIDNNWLDPNSKNYWNYVADHIEGFNGSKWNNKTLPSNSKQNNTKSVIDAFVLVGAINK